MCILQAVLLRSLARNIPSNLWICSEILPGVFQNLEILRNLCQKFGILTNLFYHLEIFRNLFQNLVIFENLFRNLVIFAKNWRLRNLVGDFAWFRTPCSRHAASLVWPDPFRAGLPALQLFSNENFFVFTSGWWVLISSRVRFTLKQATIGWLPFIFRLSKWSPTLC